MLKTTENQNISYKKEENDFDSSEIPGKNLQ